MRPDRLRILVPIDFSEHSLRALDYALEWALRAPCELHLLHVVVDGFREPTSGELIHDLGQLLHLAGQELHRLVGEKAGEESLSTIGRHVAAGPPALEILGAAARLQVDLIVMGSHGVGGVTAMVMGSVAEKVVRQAACPVLCVRPGAMTEPRAWRRIVCAVDFSEHAHAAMLAAVEVARHLAVELLLLHVEEDEGARARLAEWRREARRAGAREVSVALAHGEPGDAIVRYLGDEGGDLLVVGTHGRTGILALLAGSVTRTVLRRAPCPVLTVRPPVTDEVHAAP